VRQEADAIFRAREDRGRSGTGGGTSDTTRPTNSTGRPAWSTTSLLFDVFVAGQAVGALVDEALAGSPLDATGYAVCSAVFDEEALTPTELARRLGTPLTTALDHVRALERSGVLARRRNPVDGRSFLVVLTPAGMEAHRAASQLFEIAWRQFVEALDQPMDDVRASLVAITAAAAEARRHDGS
jgi:DNA-binding MarR family transcriptional regulator